MPHREHTERRAIGDGLAATAWQAPAHAGTVVRLARLERREIAEPMIGGAEQARAASRPGEARHEDGPGASWQR